MSNRLASNHSNASSHNTWLILWLALVISSLVFCVSHIRNQQSFYSDVFALIPTEESNSALKELTQAITQNFENRLLILIKHGDTGAELTQQLEQKLSFSQAIRIDNSFDNWQQPLVDFYQDHSQQLLTPELSHLLQTNTNTELAQTIAQTVISPTATPSPLPLNQDPLNQLGHWLAQLQPELAISQQQGRSTITYQNQSWFFISATLTGSPFDNDTQTFIGNTLAEFQSNNPSVELLTSGLVFHASAGTQLAKNEISTVGLGSIVGIVLLVLLVFHSIQPLFGIAIVLAAACLFALSACLLAFGKIHLITLAFGSTLLGVAVDYVFHFLVKAHKLGDSALARKKVKGALAVGALSSIAAYLIQATTPFPGLQQMAVFSASGLAGAWLTVYVLSPYYRPNKALKLTQIFSMAVAPIYRKLGNRKLQYSALIAIAITCIVTIVLLPSNDSILHLNTSTPALLDAEKRVQTIFSQTSSSQFFLVSANTENELLSNLSTLTEILRQKNVSASNSLEKFIPRQSIQLDSQHLVQQQLQGDDGALSQLCELLSFDCNIFTEFNATQSQTLTITKALREIPNIIPPTINSDGKWYSIKSIHPQSDINYQAIAKQVTGTEFINRTQRTSDLLGRYRLTVSVVLVLTLAVLSLGFYLRYRQDCIKILLPLFTALLLTTAIANLQGLTLFHLMALLLVMGIGIDTAIFYQEVGIDGDSWLAASLSSLTSVLAFGLLSLSAVPILHQFGQVVLVGIVFCWLLTPLFFIKNKPYKGIDS